jgi:hypothetical protein
MKGENAMRIKRWKNGQNILSGENTRKMVPLLHDVFVGKRQMSSICHW